MYNIPAVFAPSLSVEYLEKSDRVQMKNRKLKMGLAVSLVALGPVGVGIFAIKHQQAKMRG